ncbi:hypothetical protein JCM3765_005145 [Sporobolomyces pararoseus]
MSRTASDRYQRQVLELVKQPGNNQCADCKASNPRWASWDQGVFLCVKCASMHRKIGSHITKVKSLTLDTWTKEQVDNMRKLGNVKVNSLLNPDERRNPPPPPDSDDSRNSELERFVRNKYEYKVYQDFDHPAPPSPAPSPQIRSLPPSQYNGISSMSNMPPPPRRTDSQPIYSPPPGPPPPFTNSTLTSAFSPPANPTAPPLPARSATLPIPAQRKLPKSVRFPTSPPIQIPSPPDSEDEEDSYVAPRLSRHRSLPPSSTRSILVRTPANSEIPIDWAALTRESIEGGDDDGDDVPLQALGALGMKGAQVGLVGIPTSNQGFTPMAMYGANPNQQQGMGMGMMGPGGIKPLMPQFTGSAKGYLHQQHAGVFQPQNQPQGQDQGQQQATQMLVPQMTGSVSKHYGQHQGGVGGGGMDGDSFMRMFQPPTSSSNGNAGAGGNFNQQQQQQNGYSSMPNGSGFNNQFQPPAQSQQPIRTNPFTQFAQSQPSMQPQSQQQQSLQPPPTSTSIWDDLVSLSPSPSSTPQPQPSPQPLRPQLTGFVPSSSFGQQLARESSPAPTSNPTPSTSSQFLAPNENRSNSPFQPPQSQQQQPSPLKPQYTGFVPSSSFGQSLQQNGTPQPLQPQRTGFVPSSSFGQQLAKDLDGGASTSSTINGTRGGDPNGLFEINQQSSKPAQMGENRNPSPGLFDFDLFSSNSASNSKMQPPQPQFAQSTGSQIRTSSPNPFLNFSNSLGNALPSTPSAQQQPPSLQNQYSNGGGGLPMQFPQRTGAGGGGGSNPFFSNSNGFPHQQQQLQAQNTGYPQQQQFQQVQPQTTGYQAQPMRQLLTGFAGNGGNTNPFLMMGQNGGSSNGMFMGGGNGSGFR